MKRLAEFKEELDRCIRCGECRSMCPIFKVERREPASTRGRLSLVRAYLAGDIGRTPAYIRQVRDCTMCGACMSSCPARVDTPRIIAAARADLVEHDGVSAGASRVLKNLKDPGPLMPVAMKCAAWMQSLVMKATGGGGVLSRIEIPSLGIYAGRLLPELAKKPFLDLREVRALGRGAGNDKRTGAPRVAFYSGCGVNYLMPQVGLRSIELLRRAGADVIVPEGQICCGMPAYSTGDVDSAREMAAKNIEVFEHADVDYIVTSCATCGHALRSVMAEVVSSDPEMRGRAEALACKVRDISEILETLGFDPASNDSVGGRPGRVVTYHDPCHLGRYQGVREQPRDLMKAKPGLTVKEMKNPCRCCGLGGGLAFSNYELSSDIARFKAESIRDSGADVVATGCPGCIVQIRDSLNRLGVDVEVRHVVELL